MAAGGGLTPASRKPEGPRKFSERTVTKKIPDPFCFPDQEDQNALNLSSS